MISSSSTDFTASDGRRFAFPVGTAFLVLSGILFWREKEIAFQIAGAAGVILYLAGAVMPGRLGPLYRRWMALALLISRVTTPIFMAIVYFLVLTPTGLLMRLLGRKPIRHSRDEEGFWKSTTGGHGDLSRQF